MKKKLVSLVLVAVIVFSMCVPAFATTKFNQSVFDDKKDSLFIDTDDMTGTTSVYPVAWLLGQTSLFLDDSSFIMLDPIIYLTDSNDYFNVHFKYYGTTPFYFNGITIKVGDNRYSFSKCYTNHSASDDGKIYESISFTMKNETKKFMSDLKDHRDDEIKVRISGSLKNLDFVLTDDMKNNLLDLYDLYVAGGGTRDSNMRDITVLDPVVVSKNGEVIDGLVKEKLIDALFRALS